MEWSRPMRMKGDSATTDSIHDMLNPTRNRPPEQGNRSLPITQPKSGQGVVRLRQLLKNKPTAKARTPQPRNQPPRFTTTLPPSKVEAHSPSIRNHDSSLQSHLFTGATPLHVPSCTYLSSPKNTVRAQCGVWSGPVSFVVVL